MSINDTAEQKEIQLFCRVIFRNGKPIMIEKLDPFIPEVIDLEAAQARTKQETRAAVIAEVRSGLPDPHAMNIPGYYYRDAVNELLTKMEGTK